MRKYQSLTIGTFVVASLFAIPHIAKADSLKVGKIKNENAIIITNKTAMSKKVAGDFAQYTLYINDVHTINGEKYYRVQTSEDINNAIGYVKASDLTINPTKAVPTASPNYTIKATSAQLHEMPEGSARQLIDRVNKNDVVQVEKTLRVGNKTYILGTLPSGLRGWINITNDVGRKTISQPVKKETQHIERPKVRAVKETPQMTQQPRPVGPGIEHIDVPYRIQDAMKIQFSLHPKPQSASGFKWKNARKKDVLDAMNPETAMVDPVQKYQFLVLNQPQNLSAEQLNVLLQGKGILEGRGEAFRQASLKYNINEIYLISHAFLETAEGNSTLARGVKVKGENKHKRFYNMYGVGAYDKDAVKYGAKFAANVGWDTPDKAIIGGAEFIANGFISDTQNTLYTMRWNPMSPGNSQYATDILWASANAHYIYTYYQQLGISGGKFNFIHYAN
ncbi:N-acetylglucosaminidase [Macrococcoides caseolyticum]|uniref:N-acetylglucosaminidase n=1 Tax=Macrococcoides caseolyticum TaxID=69966 RepID=UPI001F3BA894|nr:N-acetylglucosaminidase [Macrococcus caseolyticus]MCE4955944.1 N-acetylglucosaminidase [Macrococcus caseolyticus]